MSIQKADSSPFNKINAISTGLPQLDLLIGIGGYPTKRIVQITGHSGVGKSTLAAHSVAAAQEAGHKALYVDSELKYNNEYVRSLGVDTSKLDLLQEKIGETLLQETIDAANTGKYRLIVLDSVSKVVPREILEKGMDEPSMATSPRLWARFMRHIKSAISEHDIALVLLNHERPDFMSNRIKVVGGNEVEEQTAVWIRLTPGGDKLMKSGKQVGKTIRAKIQKNQVASTEGQETKLNLVFGRGYEASFNTLEEGLGLGVITKQGNTLFLGETKLGVGINRASDFLKEHPEIEEQIRAEIKALQT